MVRLWVFMLFGGACMAAPLSESITVSAGSPDSVKRGQTATLPCWLNPSQSAEDMEVRWYRGDHFDAPVMLYKAKKFDYQSQEASYNGRVSFGLKDPSSGGLKTGDVSLKLINVTVEDAGDYTCYVSSEGSRDSTTAHLRVTVMGSPPLLSAVWTEDNMANVSCGSEGWYPQPVLRWSNRTSDLTHDGLIHSTISSGLYSVQSWLTLPVLSEVSCSVGFDDQEMQKARFRLENPPPAHQRDSRSSSGGWAAFGILLSIVLAALALGAVYFKKGKKAKSGCDRVDGIKTPNCNEETETLLPKKIEQSPALSTLRKFYVNVQLEDTNNEFIRIRNTIVRDNNSQDFPDGDNVTCLTALKGKSGFTCGQAYWEVSLVKANVEPKKSWWIGVTSEAKIPQESGFSPNTSNGFWFLSSSPDKENALQFSTEPTVFFPVQSRPRKVGVYLDYDRNELSFYSVEDESLIGSVAARFTREVFPFFNPGKNDKGVMEILQRTEQTNDAEAAQPSQTIDISE